MVDFLQYDTEGRLVAKIALTPEGEWMILPEPDYPFVIMVETRVVKLWDRKNNRSVEFADGKIKEIDGGKDESVET